MVSGWIPTYPLASLQVDLLCDGLHQHFLLLASVLIARMVLVE